MYLQKLIKQALFALFVMVVISYTVYKLIPLLSGPEIIINSADSKESEGLVIIKGQSLRTKELKIFDKITEMNENGEFIGIIVKHEPYTTVIISAVDRWGKNNTTQLLVN